MIDEQPHAAAIDYEPAIRFPNPYKLPGRLLQTFGAILIATVPLVLFGFAPALNLGILGLSLVGTGTGLLGRGRYLEAKVSQFRDRKYLVRWTYSGQEWPRWVRFQLGHGTWVSAAYFALSLIAIAFACVFASRALHYNPPSKGKEELAVILMFLAVIAAFVSGVLFAGAAINWTGWMGHAPYVCYVSQEAIVLPGGRLIMLYGLTGAAVVNAFQDCPAHLVITVPDEKRQGVLCRHRLLVPPGGATAAKQVAAALLHHHHPAQSQHDEQFIGVRSL